MIPHDFLTMYWVKAAAYLIAVTFLLLFIPFWRYVNAERVGQRVAVAETPKWLGQIVDWFFVPGTLHFHPGHAWTRVEEGDLVTVGIDDFAQKLVGQLSNIMLPELGSSVSQGEKGWSLTLGSKSVDMLSPVEGTVVAVNDRVLASPGTVNSDPYGNGWLLKVKAPRFPANTKQLLSGALARRWLEAECDRLQAMMTPDLGRLYQDGGLPIHGMARGLNPDNWDEVAREFFLT